MFKSVKKNDKGMVLTMVIMITMVMMVYTLGIVSTNVSQVTSGQRQADRIKAEQLAKGAFWVAYMSDYNLGNAITIPTTEATELGLDSITFEKQVGTGPDSTDTWSIGVAY